MPQNFTQLSFLSLVYAGSVKLIDIINKRRNDQLRKSSNY
ncbi:hypothetical protein HMPREF9103_01202 [Lentilactobacillus parafarraginis F0439]|uniref:Uncharacterized protein n=1 Tax=Lentilactobacillus parafarraginis F0439 TaxID=797515 RepID=G9ZN99_9LACO|nr:hypothetical protein HMPREF9103_01202 [Lentilactobacillus parafarraginis F0439]